jgi:hypothetical protein
LGHDAGNRLEDFEGAFAPAHRPYFEHYKMLWFKAQIISEAAHEFRIRRLLPVNKVPDYMNVGLRTDGSYVVNPQGI